MTSTAGLPAEVPFVSVIVPSYLRPDRLAACLRGLAGLDYPRDRFEVIVVDDGSAVPPENVVLEAQERLDVRLLTQTHGGPAQARNTGAGHARGSVLAFIDDDCQPAADWLRVMSAAVATAPEAIIGGRTINALPTNPYSTASQLIVDYLYEHFNASAAQARFVTSNNIAVAADRFRDVGGFDATFPRAAAEDREFCDRWLRAGRRIAYVGGAVVSHAHVLTLRTFWRQHFTYGRGAYRFHQLRRQRHGEPLRPDPAFYRNLLLCAVRMHGGGRLPLTALVVLSQVANAAGFFWERLALTGSRDSAARHRGAPGGMTDGSPTVAPRPKSWSTDR